MARQIDPMRQLDKSTDEVREQLRGMDDQDRQYLLERPWMIAEYRRQGYTEEMDSVTEGQPMPDDPTDETRVTTDDMRVGTQVPQRLRPRPTGVLRPEDQDAPEPMGGDDEAYEDWSKADLVAEVESRNASRGDDEKLPKGGTKEELVQRLYEDDENAD